jgi:hypothetical protein
VGLLNGDLQTGAGQKVVNRKVFRPGIVNVICGDYRDTQGFPKLHQVVVEKAAAGQKRFGQFQIEVFAPDILVALRSLYGLSVPAPQDEGWYFPPPATRKGDDPFMVFLQVAALRFPSGVVQVGPGEKAAQVGVTGGVPGQQGEVVAARGRPGPAG